jgi:hypothetical protein
MMLWIVVPPHPFSGFSHWKNKNNLYNYFIYIYIYIYKKSQGPVRGWDQRRKHKSSFFSSHKIFYWEWLFFIQFNFYYKKIIKLVLKKTKLIQINRFWFGYFRTKTNLNRYFWFDLVFFYFFSSGLVRFFLFGFGSVFWFQAYKTKPNRLVF